jgi:nitrogen-specific signal transduction histidine kinase
MELAHANRIATMGQLTSSIAHEVAQPIAGARNNARAALNFLARRPPDLGEAREALDGIVANADRAGDILDRIRDHINKAPPKVGRFDMNEAVRDAILLNRGEAVKNGVSVQTQLAEGLPFFRGDRVQIQQVMVNLMGAEPEEPLACVRAILHDQVRGHGHGAVYLPLDHRSPRRTAVGDPVRTAGCTLSVYDPRWLSRHPRRDVAVAWVGHRRPSTIHPLSRTAALAGNGYKWARSSHDLSGPRADGLLVRWNARSGHSRLRSAVAVHDPSPS